MGAELFVRARRDEDDESVAAFMTRRFGCEAATYLAEPLLAGIHAGDVDRLSIRALFPRLVEAERKHGSLIRAFRRQRRPPGDGAFRSLPGGLSEMVRALERTLPAGSVRLRAPVKEIAQTPGAFRVELSSGDTLAARALVLATPAYVTASIVKRFDPVLSDLCGMVSYASTATVAMAFEREAVRHPLHGSGFVVPKVENSGLLAATWLSSKWPSRAPDGRVLLRTFVGGARDPRALERSDAELTELSMRALAPLLGITGEPLFVRVYRWQRASAQHEVGHLERLATIERTLLQHSGLFLTGSGFRGVGIPDCVADGRATGKQVSEWLAGG
jgi:oxygen-dependent protoporphyrinogen oxidase